MMLAVLLAVALAAWVTADRNDHTAPVRAGLTGAVRAAVRTAGSTARTRWADRSAERAARTARRRSRWSRTRTGRAALALEGTAVAAGRGLAIVGPAAWAGARAAGQGWRDGYTTERDRRRQKRADQVVVPARKAAEEGGGGVLPTRADARGSSSLPPTSTTPVPTGTGPDTPSEDHMSTATGLGDVPDLATLDAELADQELIARESALVSAGARVAADLGDPSSLPFKPGARVESALIAIAEVAPKDFDHEAWLQAVLTARREVAAVREAADQLTSTGASGHTDQFVSH